MLSDPDPVVGPYDALLAEQIRAAAPRGTSRIQLIKTLRERTPLTLKAAKDAVDDYCLRRPAEAEQLRGGSISAAGCLLTSSFLLILYISGSTFLRLLSHGGRLASFGVLLAVGVVLLLARYWMRKRLS